MILDTAGRLHIDEEMMEELAGDQEHGRVFIRLFSLSMP